MTRHVGPFLHSLLYILYLCFLIMRALSTTCRNDKSVDTKYIEGSVGRAPHGVSYISSPLATSHHIPDCPPHKYASAISPKCMFLHKLSYIKSILLGRIGLGGWCI